MSTSRPDKSQKYGTGESTFSQVRVVIDGHTGSGRETLRGVVRYIRTVKPLWRLHVEMRPWVPRRAEWDRDVGTICAVSNEEFINSLIARGHPLVNCLAHYENLRIHTVRTDDLSIGRIAARHLLDRGFERFAFWSLGDRSEAARLRLQGMADELALVGHTVRAIPQDWRAGAEDLPDDDFSLPDTLRAIGFPLGLMCAHDTIGRMASTELAASGIAVPEQVALLGVDNDQLQCEISTPMLSSIDVPYEELGFRAAERLNAILLHDAVPLTPRLIAPDGVVERQSTDVVAVSDPILSKAARFIREHACDPCTVADVMRSVGVSRRWLETQFVGRFKRTPHEELTRIRMERATYLLRTSSLSIQIVAAHCGYSLVQNFGRVFRKFVGQTPAAYRSAHAPTPIGQGGTSKGE